MSKVKNNSDFEDENTKNPNRADKKSEKKALKKAQKESATIVSPEKGDFHAFTLRVQKARSKAISAGTLYWFLTILFAVAAFLPMYVASSGSITVINFWRPFKSIVYIKGNVVPVLLSLVLPVLYLCVLLTAVINVIKAFSHLGELHKKPSKKTGANRNADACEKTCKNFSGTYASIIIFGFLMKLLCGVNFTPMFYAVVALGILLHFLTAYASGNISRFNLDGKGNSEVKHMYGRFAPIIRNIFQWIVCGVLIYYFLKFNSITNIYKLFEKGGFSSVMSNSVLRIRYFIVPVLQILMIIILICLFNHTAGNAEFVNGAKEFFSDKKRYGAKTARVSALLLFLIVVGYEVLLFLDKNFELDYTVLYFGVIAIALFLEEVFMAKLPNFKENVIVYYQSEQEPLLCPNYSMHNGYNSAFANQNTNNTNETNSTPVINTISSNNQKTYEFITRPALFMQPNGKPIMVMPMVESVPVENSVNENSMESNGAVSSNIPQAKIDWNEAAGLTKEEADQTIAREKKIRALTDKWVGMANLNSEDLSENESLYSNDEPMYNVPVQKSETTKKLKVVCPDCGSKLIVNDGAFAYRCSICGEIFQVQKKNK